MLGNYLKTAARNLSGSLLYSSINILGLGIGLACCLLILLYVRHEFSYESGFAEADRIYRISREYYPDEGARARVPASNNGPVAPALNEDFSQIAAAGRIYGGGLTVNLDEVQFTEPELRFADQQIVDIFGFDWIDGAPDGALDEPFTIVLNRTLAEKIFNASDVAGRTVTFSDGTELRVTGVIEDLPPNTHLSLSGMVSMATLQAMVNESFFSQWNSSTDFHTYFLLQQGGAVSDIEAAIPGFIERHMGPEVAARSTMQVMNIRGIHLRSDRDEEWKPPGDSTTVYSFALVAGCILLIACINFMSIATARSTRRAKEVGMRKSIGASRAELVMQFLSESFLTAVSGMLVAVVLVELLLPTMSAFAGVDLSVSYAADRQVQFAILCLCLISGLVAGSYPALFLSAFSPARVLRGEQGGIRGLAFRNLLVIIQFTIAITIVISTFVVYSQREYALNMDLGFDSERIVVVEAGAREGFQEDWPLLRQKLLEDPAIEKVTASSFLPFGFNDNQYPIALKGSSVNTRIQLMFTAYDFFSTYNIDLLAGRVFNEQMMSEALAGAEAGNGFTARVILNREASSALGLDPGDAVNAELNIAGQVDVVVVGVVEDTYFESIHRNTRPLVFVLSPPEIPSPFTTYRTATIRFDAAAEPQALAHIADTWRELYPGRELRSHYLGEDFRAMYLQEARQSQLFTWFSILAIVIACFGLFGLASFNAERRTKEIGVRKVMGSSTWRIVVLLTNDFSKLVLVSNVIAWPVAYVAMSRWLENFAYRIDLTPLIFVGSGLIALCVAWVTVGGTAAKAASRKPVLALRYE